MNQHTVTEDELDDWMTDKWTHFASSYGPDSNKSFLVNISDKTYQIIDDCMVVYEGDDKAAAIRAYNEAR